MLYKNGAILSCETTLFQKEKGLGSIGESGLKNAELT
jgi:hypothetical protein